MQRSDQGGRGEKLERVLIAAVRREQGAAFRAIDGAVPAAGLVRHLIREGDLEIGDAVPADVLARVLDIHRNTANKAVGLLVDEGYVSRRKGRPARVVSARPSIPDRKTKMISHTAVALEAQIPISTDNILHEICTLDDVAPDLRASVQRHLNLAPDEKLIALARVRKIRMDAMTWTPAIAESVFMRAALLPAFLHSELMSGQVESLRDLLQGSGFDVINSEYRIRIASLPSEFHQQWMTTAGITKAQVQALRFLRLESTTHCPEGPISFSMAYLVEDLYTLSTTDFALRVEVHRDDPPSNGGTQWRNASGRGSDPRAAPQRRGRSKRR